MARNFAGDHFPFRMMHFFHMGICSIRSISRNLNRAAAYKSAAAGAGA